MTSRWARAGGILRGLPTIAVALLAACDPSGMPVTPDTEGVFTLSRSISDGSSEGGNADFWFLPPVAENPGDELEFDPQEFNPNLFPLVDICKVLAGSENTPHGSVCDPENLLVNGGAAELNGNKYRLKHQTDEGDGNMVFLVTVRLGDTELGNVHMVLGEQGGNTTVPLKVGDYLVNAGSEADIVFSIENDALCLARDSGFNQETGECTSVSVDLNEGGTVGPTSNTVFVAPGTEAGTNSSTTTFTFEDCDAAWPLATPTFSDCFQVIVEEQGVTFDPPTIVSDCRGLEEFNDDLFHDHLRLYQFTQYRAEALPEASAVCPETLGALSRPASFFARLVSGVRKLVGPQPLRANAALHRGGGGEVEEYNSNFRFSLPAQMTINGGDGLDALVGDATSTPPEVLVEWLYTANPRGPDGVGDPGGPLAGVQITFDVTGGRGSLDPGAVSQITITTGANGLASPTAWTIGNVPGINTVVASAFGVSGFGVSSSGDDPFFDVDTTFTIEQDANDGTDDEVGFITFTAEGFNQIAQQDGGPIIGIAPLGDGTQAIESFYGYGTLPAPSHTSSNTGLETPRTSILFFYDGSDQDGMVMLHDKPGGKGGCADLSFSGLAGLDFIVQDDSNDKYETPPLTSARWGWNRNGSDGGVLGVVRDAPQNIVITPGFATCRPPRGGSRIDAWTLLSGTDSHALDITKALTIKGL